MLKLFSNIFGMFSLKLSEPKHKYGILNELFDWLEKHDSETHAKCTLTHDIDDVRVILNEKTGLFITPCDGILESQTKYLEALRRMQDKENDKPQV